MAKIKKFASLYRVDPRRLIIAVCKHNKADAPDELVEAQARILAQQGSDFVVEINKGQIGELSSVTALIKRIENLIET